MVTQAQIIRTQKIRKQIKFLKSKIQYADTQRDYHQDAGNRWHNIGLKQRTLYLQLCHSIGYSPYIYSS